MLVKEVARIMPEAVNAKVQNAGAEFPPDIAEVVFRAIGHLRS